MVTITFPDRQTEKVTLVFLLGRFSGRLLKTGEHLVPQAALEALAEQNIPFNVKGNASNDQEVKSDLEAILVGIDDMESGRFRPLSDVANDIRRKYGFSTQS